MVVEDQKVDGSCYVENQRFDESCKCRESEGTIVNRGRACCFIRISGCSEQSHLKISKDITIRAHANPSAIEKALQRTGVKTREM